MPTFGRAIKSKLIPPTSCQLSLVGAEVSSITLSHYWWHSLQSWYDSVIDKLFKDFFSWKTNYKLAIITQQFDIIMHWWHNIECNKYDSIGI